MRRLTRSAFGSIEHSQLERDLLEVEERLIDAAPELVALLDKGVLQMHVYYYYLRARSCELDDMEALPLMALLGLRARFASDPAARLEELEEFIESGTAPRLKRIQLARALAPGGTLPASVAGENYGSLPRPSVPSFHEDAPTDYSEQIAVLDVDETEDFGESAFEEVADGDL